MDSALRAQLPRERVLASATADNQHIHDVINKWNRISRLGIDLETGFGAGSFVDAGRALCLESAFTCDSLAYSVGLHGPHRAPARSGSSAEPMPMSCSRNGGREGGVFKRG